MVDLRNIEIPLCRHPGLQMAVAFLFSDILSSCTLKGICGEYIVGEAGVESVK